MPARIQSGAVFGLDFIPIVVEADISSNLPGFTIVGLPDTAVQESRERVKAAIKNSQLPFPRTKVTINLAPADSKKSGPIYDVPIALGVLCAEGYLPDRFLRPDVYFVGELALDGSLRPVNGLLPILRGAKKSGAKRFYIPSANQNEAGLFEGLEIIPIQNLRELVEVLLERRACPEPVQHSEINNQNHCISSTDFAHIHGQTEAKRALEIAAGGSHNVALTGAPGSGKTLLARALPSIMPPLISEELLDIASIHSVSGRTYQSHARPFRSPHHTSSSASVIGGGSSLRPGEVSLAHRGVLFLDEFPEFRRDVLEGLREPLEDGAVTISRAIGTVTFPARFILITAQNPCPCGYAESSPERCTCSIQNIQRYAKRISGPLLDRLDLFCRVPSVPISELSNASNAEPSAEIRKRVMKARETQRKRLAIYNKLTNSELTKREIEATGNFQPEALQLLKKAAEKLQLSARAYVRVLKVSRTVADLANSEFVTSDHLGEALHFRAQQEA